MLINDIERYRRYYTNFTASLWQGKIIYNIKTVHKKRGKQTLKQTIIKTL